MSNPLAQLAQLLPQIAIHPQNSRLWCQAGFLYLQINEIEEALNTFLATQQISPGQGDAHYGEAICRLKLGEADAALAAIALAIQYAPNDQRLYSAYAYLCAACGKPPETILAAYRDWGLRFAEPLKPKKPLFHGRPHPQGKIRVGYVSADFREHALMNFFGPVLQQHDRDRFEIIAFSSGHEDEKTPAIKAQFDYWNDARKLDNAALAELIRRRGIDILVDLSGHTDGTRLLTFARQPAPIQLTWYGYNGTSGMTAMDGRLTDAVMDPPGNEIYSLEPLQRLPHFSCFSAGDNFSDESSPLPFERNGYITFASLNNAQKLSHTTLLVWGRLLQQLPDARLVLIGPQAATSGQGLLASLHNRLLNTGIPLDRTTIHPQLAMAEFIQLGQQIDIALEPFPLTGAVTTAQALWMHLPSITLAGRLPWERPAAAILAAARLPQFIAQTEDEYIKIAVDLAQDTKHLSCLRANMRKHLSQSPLLDHRGFTRSLEACFTHLHQSNKQP
jgi:predicted O-linked N-acetylglucosamine transferase (SPINDLY family)